MTVKELKHTLRTAPDDAQVFMLTDKSEDNYDEVKKKIRMYHI